MMSQDERREARRASTARYRATHKEEIRAKAAQYYATHKAGYAQNYAEHREERRASNARHYAEHKKEKKAYAAQYRTDHQDEIGARQAQYRAEHKDELGAYNAQYRQTDAGRAAHAAVAHNRRVALMGVPLTAATILEVKAEYGGICPYCNQQITKGHIDHIVPVSKGGTNNRENLVWACAHCNMQKKDGSLLEFMIYRRDIALGG